MEFAPNIVVECYMGLGDILGRRRSETRIRRRTRMTDKLASLPAYDAEEEIDRTVRNLSNRAYNVGNRIYTTTQARKAVGKQVLFSTVKSGVGIVARGVLGPSKKHLAQQQTLQNKKRQRRM